MLKLIGSPTKKKEKSILLRHVSCKIDHSFPYARRLWNSSEYLTSKNLSHPPPIAFSKASLPRVS